MVEEFSTALGTALTTFVTDVTGAIGDNSVKVLGLSLGIIGIFLLWGVVKKMAKSRVDYAMNATELDGDHGVAKCDEAK